MDARERLRRYLEQRRELGESELVLDSIPVDEVMRMLGAPSRTRAAASVADHTKRESSSERKVDVRSDAATGEPVAPPPVVRPPDPPRRIPEQPATSDWRAALGNADVGNTTARNLSRRNADAGRTDTGKADAGKTDTGKVAASSPDAPPVSQNTDAGTPATGTPATGTPATGTPATGTPATGTPAWLTALGAPMGLHVGADSLHAHATRLDAGIAELPSLDAIATAVAGCTRCPLYATAKNPVPGEGNPNADFVCVGEAPGQNEDEQGRPFVGAAGQLLTKILGAIKLTRDDVFICNVLKHRPPGNRDPLPNEVHACSPYLLRQLDLLQPRVILALGSFAARTLLGTEEAIGRLRGRIHMYHGIPVVATYHPAALLRNEAWKRPAWEDVQLARRVYDASRAAMPATSE